MLVRAGVASAVPAAPRSRARSAIIDRFMEVMFLYGIRLYGAVEEHFRRGLEHDDDVEENARMLNVEAIVCRDLRHFGWVEIPLEVHLCPARYTRLDEVPFRIVGNCALEVLRECDHFWA